MKSFKQKELEASGRGESSGMNVEDEVCVFQYFYSKHRVELAEKMEQYEHLSTECEKLKKQVDELEQNPPPNVFMNSLEMWVLSSLI